MTRISHLKRFTTMLLSLSLILTGWLNPRPCLRPP
jgi:hypothetical protein